MPELSPRLPFEIDGAIDPSLVTGRAGAPLVIELSRQLGVARAIDTAVPIKQRQRGLRPSQLVESLVALWVSGGDRCQDLTTLREDAALATLLGYPLPAATTMRDFLEAFHVEGGPLWQAGPQAAIPLESAPLAGLGQANRTLVAGVQQAAPESTATLDVDATLVESHKEAATVAYDGTRGYQPVVVLWAEQDLILHDQFRDGHVPAGCGNVRLLEQAVRHLPQGIARIRLRADSARSETAVLRWCEDAAHPIEYASSADLSEPLKAEILRRPESAWQVEREEPDAIRSWAEVPYVPDDGDHRKARPCVRRVPRGAHPEAAGAPLRRREQRALLCDGHEPGGERAHPPPVAPGEGRDGRAYPSRPPDRVGGGRPPEWQVRRERRLVPAERAHVQLAHGAQALDLTRRFPDRPAQAAALPALQHGRQGRGACPSDALAADGSRPTRLTGPGPRSNCGTRPDLAGD